MVMFNSPDYDVSITPRHRANLSKGCFRYVVDTYYEQEDNWRELAYRDYRPVNRRKPRQRYD
jgi:hypothetical protein